MQTEMSSRSFVRVPGDVSDVGAAGGAVVNPNCSGLCAVQAWHDQSVGLIFELKPEQLLSNPRPQLAALIGIHVF